MTTRGKIVLTILFLGVVGFGAWKWWDKLAPRPGGGAGHSATASATAKTGADTNVAELVETQTEIPALAAPAAYQPKDNTVDVELSEYAGYAGLIAANGGR